MIFSESEAKRLAILGCCPDRVQDARSPMERHGNRIPVLDTYGYVELVESMGSDERIIEAARMSTGGKFKGWGPVHDTLCRSRIPEGWVARRDSIDSRGPHREPPFDPEDDTMWVHGGPCDCTPMAGDEKLLRYLWTNQHTTPFEMGELAFEISAPIMVYREWHRHRTQSYNELSARYTQMPSVHYLLTLERLKMSGGGNKQAQGVADLGADHDLAIWLVTADKLQRDVYRHYEAGLRLGIPKEVARLNTPVARYSTMRAKANLLNWLKFLRLRMEKHAQWEIRQYANAVGVFIAEKFPHTWALFMEGMEGKV